MVCFENKAIFKNYPPRLCGMVFNSAQTAAGSPNVPGYSFSKPFLDMIPAVFGKLKDSGFFFDPIARDIEINFMPNLLSKVKSKVNFKISRPKF